jgi:hypothetical protein
MANKLKYLLILVICAFAQAGFAQVIGNPRFRGKP